MHRKHGSRGGSLSLLYRYMYMYTHRRNRKGLRNAVRSRRVIIAQARVILYRSPSELVHTLRRLDAFSAGTFKKARISNFIAYIYLSSELYSRYICIRAGTVKASNEAAALVHNTYIPMYTGTRLYRPLHLAAGHGVGDSLATSGINSSAREKEKEWTVVHAVHTRQSADLAARLQQCSASNAQARRERASTVRRLISCQIYYPRTDFTRRFPSPCSCIMCMCMYVCVCMCVQPLPRY